MKFLKKSENAEPQQVIPSIKTDLKNLADDKPTIIWFGHSSYLIKFKGLNITPYKNYFVFVYIC